nr:hypothetical protein [Cryptosporangium arvum]
MRGRQLVEDRVDVTDRLAQRGDRSSGLGQTVHRESARGDHPLAGFGVASGFEQGVPGVELDDQAAGGAREYGVQIAGDA